MVDQTSSSRLQEESKQVKRDSLTNDEDDCRAVPFIKFMPSEGKFELDAEAEAFLKSLGDTKLGVVAVCGKYRTGKSYLLNKLFVETYFQNKRSKDKKNNVFQVSPTINACTKGLWLWKRVIKTENDVSMIVVDTEGLGAYDEDENHDAKIFLLALLLSSLLIYNSVGTIDENALNSLSLVIQLAKKIQMKKKPGGEGETQEDIDALAQMFPSFLWVLRDFALKLVDSDGVSLTPKQYLESALREQKGCSEAAESKNRVRRLLQHFFPERDCCTLVRPTEQEKNLQTLVQLPDNALRPEFIDQMNKLKHKVFTRARPKTLNGHALNGSMLVELAQAYVKALNDGEVPVIESAWTNVCQFEQQRAFREAQMCYQTQITSRLKCNKQPDLDVKSVLREIREAAYQALKKDFIGDLKQLESFKEKLAIEIKQNSKAAVKEIGQRLDQQLSEIIIKRIETEIEGRVRRGDTGLKEFEELFNAGEDLLNRLQSEHHPNHSERLEYLFRRLFQQQKLPKLLSALHSTHFKTPSHSQQALLEHQLKLASDECTRQKEIRAAMQREQWEKESGEERERKEMKVKLKILEVKVGEYEEKMKEAERQLKYYRQREFKDANVQSEDVLPKIVSFERYTQSQPPNVYSQEIQTNATINFGNEEPLHQAKKSSTSNVMEQNVKILQEILTTVNNQYQQPFGNSSNTYSTLQSNSLTEILKNNQILSSAVDQAERRCSQLEKKLDSKQKYATLIKNCQRLQCKECNKLYTPALFGQHFQHCTKRASNASNNSIAASGYQSQQSQHHMVNPPQMMQESSHHSDNEEEEEDAVHMFEGGCHEEEMSSQAYLSSMEIKRKQQVSVGMSNFNDFLRHHHDLMHERGDTFLAKIINIETQQPFKSSDDTLDLTFCIFNNGHVSTITRNLSQIRSVMSRVQRRCTKSPSEQSQIAKWVMEIDQANYQREYHLLAQIVETFFQTIHKRIIENGLQLDKHVIVEDIEGDTSKHYYINEFVEFFALQHQEQLVLDESLAQPTATKRYTMGGDDEVIVQTPYDEEEIFSAPGSSCILMNKRTNSFSHLRPQNHECQQVQHTIHLDGEQSIDNNSAMHMVSFFSIEGEDDHQNIKKNLLPHTVESQPSVQSSVDFATAQQEEGFYQIVSAKQMAFDQINNMQEQQQPVSASFLLQNNNNTQYYSKLSTANLFKKSYQSPLPPQNILPKKSHLTGQDINRRQQIPSSPLTQQHHQYFNTVREGLFNYYADQQ